MNRFKEWGWEDEECGQCGSYACYESEHNGNDVMSCELQELRENK